MLKVKTQHGATLVVSLIMLVLITMLALSTMRTATMEERMSRFSREQSMAFQAAEVALRDAEAEFGPNGGTRSDDLARGAGGTGFVPDCVASGTGAPDARFRGLCTMAVAGADPAWAMLNGGLGTTYGTYRRIGGAAPVPLVMDGSPNSVVQQPRYLAEILPSPGEVGPNSKQFRRYRITAQGFGPSANVQAWVQSNLVLQ